jgi:kynurenine formamidase
MPKKFFDLSQPLYDNCPGWPTWDLVDVTYEAIIGNDGCTTERIDLNVHTGTHIDAPYHFDSNGKTIDEVDVERYQGAAVLMDLRPMIHPREAITSAHLEPYAHKIEPDDILIINTGWGKKRSFSAEYYHDWPYIDADGAHWIVDHGVKGVGIDGLSVGGWYEGTGRPVHEIILPREIWALEELNIPDELMPYERCYLMAFPMKLRGFSGAPARAVAMVETQDALA